MDSFHHRSVEDVDLTITIWINRTIKHVDLITNAVWDSLTNKNVDLTDAIWINLAIKHVILLTQSGLV